MNYYSYQGRITGQDRIEEFDRIFKELLVNDPSLFCEISLTGPYRISYERKFEIELSTENYENFIRLRDYICFK